MKILFVLTILALGSTQARSEEVAFEKKTLEEQTKPNIPPLVHPDLGTSASSADGEVKVTLIGKKQHYGAGPAETIDPDINSPKSVNIHPNGKKYYVNSLEGCTTISYDFQTGKKLKVIRHTFRDGDKDLWAETSGLYPFTHYKSNLNTFSGKPVESTFSHGGRYLWVPYYRRSYDINAQDPSAVAVIDTETDSIVRMLETGPLPKMITTSPDGKTVAISHWGNNTVGLIDISSEDSKEWHHTKMLVVDYILPLNYPLDQSVDRDNGSGYALRGTVFTPDGKYLLVGCMGGGGGIAVIDINKQKYLGRVLGMRTNVRHLVINNGYLYLSINGAGVVQRVKLDDFMEKALNMKGSTTQVNNWEECAVGKGARTISITSDGRYLFAACNTVSRLYVVDTQTMKSICNIPVDSYPVGLDLSVDGKLAFVTSQGRSNTGGNAVDIFEIEYKNPPVIEEVEEPVEEKAAENVEDETNVEHTSSNNYLYGGGAVAAIAVLGFAFYTFKSKKA